MNKAYQDYMATQREQESELVKKVIELAKRLETEFNVSTDMENPDADRLHTPPCKWNTKVENQTADQLDSLHSYLDNLGDLVRDAQRAVALLLLVRENIRDTKPEDFED